MKKAITDAKENNCGRIKW